MIDEIHSMTMFPLQYFENSRIHRIRLKFKQLPKALAFAAKLAMRDLVRRGETLGQLCRTVVQSHLQRDQLLELGRIQACSNIKPKVCYRGVTKP